MISNRLNPLISVQDLRVSFRMGKTDTAPGWTIARAAWR